MTIEVQSVGALRALVESSFCADGTGTLANYTYVPFNEGSAQVTLTTDELDPMQAVQSRVEGRAHVLGKRSATLAFTMNLAPTGTAAASTVAAASGALGLLLKATMGGENLGTGTAFTAGSTPDVVNLTAVTGIAAGALIGWPNADGVVEWREVESVAALAVTLKHAFSGSPAATDVCYAAATYYFTEDPSTSLQFIVEGVESDDRWLLLGGQAVGGVTFAIDPSGAALPTASFSLTFADWKKASETTGAITGVLASATYSGYDPIVGHVGEFRAFTVGTSTLSSASIVHISALSFNPKIIYVPVTSPSGTNGVYRWRAGRSNPPIEGSFSTFFEDLTWWTNRDASTAMHLQYTMGTAAGESVVLTAPTVQISNPQRAADGELAGQTVAFRGRRDTDVGSSTTALAKSPVRIHIA